MSLTIEPTQIFQGVATLSYKGTSIGGTTAPPKFGVDIETYSPRWQGAKGDVVATQTITRAVPKVTFEINAVTAGKLAWSMPGATESGGVITWRPGRIPTDAYGELILEGVGVDGRLLRVTLDNAMSAASFEADLNDQKETGIPVTMVGHYPADDPTLFPANFEIVEP